MKSFLVSAAVFLGIAALITLAIWAEISVWSECRADHSFLYCMRMMSK